VKIDLDEALREADPEHLWHPDCGLTLEWGAMQVKRLAAHVRALAAEVRRLRGPEPCRGCEGAGHVLRDAGRELARCPACAGTGRIV
jgi:hypothetical protein